MLINIKTWIKVMFYILKLKSNQLSKIKHTWIKIQARESGWPYFPCLKTPTLQQYYVDYKILNKLSCRKSVRYVKAKFDEIFE